MSGIILLGILSGMIFGALAMMVRPYAGAVIITPIVAMPFAYGYVWRDALVGPCLFADTFGTEACTPTRAFFTATLNHADDAVVIMTAHIITAFALVLILTGWKKFLDYLATPRRKEAKSDIPAETLPADPGAETA